MQLPTKTLLALLPFFLQQANGQTASGTGTTTRYWDCCKPSCAWTGKASLLADSSPVTTCDISNNPLTDYDTASGCNGGGAYQCSNESPWAVTDDLAYGYAAVNIAGGSESSWCCACYELTFTSGPVSGKKMIVQATNTGGDLGSNQFDISIPGGGVGIYNGCTAEWGAPSSGWGAQYGGISSRSNCDSFPAALQDGCYWRFDWFQAADNPSVSFKQVQCPAALSANTGCVRADDSAAALASAPTGSAVSSSSSAAKVAAVATSIPAAAVESSVSSSVSSVEPVSTTEAASTESSIQVAISSTASETPSSSAVVPAATSSIESSTSTTSSASSTSSTAAVSTEDSCEA